jgi:hypothetical protein
VPTTRRPCQPRHCRRVCCSTSRRMRGRSSPDVTAHVALLLGMMRRHTPLDTAFRVRVVGAMPVTEGTLGSFADEELRYGSDETSTVTTPLRTFDVGLRCIRAPRERRVSHMWLQ